MIREEILQRLNLFKGLDEEGIAAISRLCEERTYSAGEAIFSEGCRGEELYILTKGTIRIEVMLRGQNDRATVHRLTGGQIFGELALADKRSRSATAICEDECEVLSISCERMLDLFEESKHIGYVVMKNLGEILATRLRKTNLQLVASILWE